jgi:hypothetical protein
VQLAGWIQSSDTTSGRAPGGRFGSASGSVDPTAYHLWLRRPLRMHFSCSTLCTFRDHLHHIDTAIKCVPGARLGSVKERAS